MSRAIDILMIEDNPADVRLAKEALREGPVRCKIHVATDGEKGLAFLRRRGAAAGKPKPELILLDQNLPRKNGHEVLAEIKSDGALRRIPVVILTSSKAEEDVVRSYDSNCNCYITKPLDLEKFIEVIRSIEHFWLDIATLPPT